MSNVNDSVKQALINKLKAEGYGDKPEPTVPSKQEPLFQHDDTTPTAQMKEYEEIVGHAHPSGNKYYFTVYTPDDWDEDVRSLIPSRDETFEFDDEYALSLLMAIEYNKSAFAYGPPGSGKSSAPEQICARLNYPFMFIAGMGGTEPSDYVGSPWVEGGNMSWKDGPASFAVRKGVFLLYDEPFKASAQTNMCFQSLLDHRRTLKLYGHPDTIKGNLKAHPKFRICLADNVRGIGDQMDKFAAEIQDQSTLNRTAYKVHVDYVKPDTEKRILKSLYPEATDRLINGVVSLAGLIRTAYKKGEVEMPYSLRDTSEFIQAALVHRNAGEAFKQTYYGYIQEDSERKALKDAWRMVFPNEELA